MASVANEHMPMDYVIDALHTLRSEPTTYDCAIKSEKKEFLSHRLVLGACSSYFRSLLDTTKQEEPIIKLDLPPFITEDAIEIILEYMYTGVIPNSNTNIDLLHAVVSASHFLKMDDLFHASLEVLADKLSATNIQRLFQLGLTYADDGLEKQIISHLENKICHLGLRDDFLTLPTVQLKKILTHFTSYTESQDDIRRACMSWVNSDTKRQSEFKTQIMHSLAIRSEKHVDKEHGYPEIDLETCIFVSDNNQGLKQTSQNVTVVERQHLLFFRTVDGHSNVMTYDVETDNWSLWKRFPIDTNEDGVSIVYGHHIYFMGGWVKKTDLSSSSIIYDYCLNTNVLAATAQLCFPVINGSAAGLNDQLYVVGGWGGSEKKKSSRRTQRFDVVTRVCHEVAQTNEKYLRSRMVSFKDFLYVTDKSSVYAGKLERYDPLQDQWTVIASRNLNWFNVAFSGSQMFVTGPYANAGLNVYDISANEWLSTISFEDSPNGIYGFWSATKQNRPVLLVQSRDQLWYIYDIQSSSWERELHCPMLYQDYSAVVLATFLQPSLASHSTPVHPVLSSLNCLRNELHFTDVTLVCTQQEMGAHRFVLSAALPYFQTMFCSGFQEAKSSIAILPNIRAEIMEIVLSFLYTGLIQEDNIPNCCLHGEVLEVAHLMEIKELYNLALKQLAARLRLHNFPEISRIADLYGSQGLMSLVSTLLAKNFPELVQSDDFLSVSGHLLKRVLLHPELKLSCDLNYVTERLIQWCQCDPTSREPDLSGLFRLLRFEERAGKKSSVLKTVRNLVSRIPKRDMSELYAFDHVVVGYNHWPQRSETQSALVSLYDLNTKRFLEKSSVPFSIVTGMFAIGYGSYLYYFGGGEVGSDSGKLIYQYCIFSSAVVSQSFLKLPIVAGGGGVLEDTIYVVGSCSAQRYIPASCTCEVIAKTKREHNSPVVFGCKSNVVVFSFCETQQDAVMEQYNPLVDQWTTVTHLSSPGHAQYIAIMDDMFYMVASSEFMKFLDYGYGRPGGCIPNYTHVFAEYTYDFNTSKWSVTQKEQFDVSRQKIDSFTSIFSPYFQSYEGLTTKEILRWCGTACATKKCNVYFLTNGFKVDLPSPSC